MNWIKRNLYEIAIAAITASAIAIIRFLPQYSDIAIRFFSGSIIVLLLVTLIVKSKKS